MKLFKKNNADAEKSGDEVQPRLKKTANNNDKNSKNRSLNSWIIQPIAISAICFGLCYLLMEIFFLKPLDLNYQSQVTNHQAIAIERNVSLYLANQVAWVNSLTSSDVLGSALSTEVLKKIKPEIKDIKVFSIESLNQVGTQDTMSFASMDLLRRAAKGEKTQIEAFLNDKTWFFQTASKLESQSQGIESNDIVLVVFDLTGIENIIKSYQNTFDGEVSLLVDGINRPLVQVGNAIDENSITLATSLSKWSIKYSPSSNAFYPQDRTMLWFVILAVLIVYVLVLTLILRINLNTIKSDLQRATQMVSKAMESEKQFINNFHYGEVFTMANAIVLHARKIIASLKKQEAKTKQKEAVTPLDSLEDEPLFDDDLFDIDELDESDSRSSGDNYGGVNSQDLEAIVEEKEILDIEVSPGIFRAYDIRGIVDETLSPAIVELLGKAIASEALAQGQTTLCIGYDGRLSSESYAETLLTGVISTGMNAILIGQVPTPVLYFATHHFETGSGIMITGSHNPSNYNGFKMMIAGNTLSGEAIQKLYNRILMQDFAEGQGERSEQEIDRNYLDAILNDIAVAAPLKVVIDAGNGVAGGLAPELIEELGCEVIPLHCDVDGTFPNHHPDPGKPENLQDLIAAVKEHGADIGLAFDGDGDRIGVVTNTGKIIWPDRLLMLFAKDVVSRNPGADIIYDVKCSRRLNGLISSYGGRPVMWKTGHSLIKAKMKETGALLAGEMSGHVFFKERWFGFDDGLYSAARLLEILGVEDKTSDEVFAEFPEDVSTPEINVAVTDESKFSIVEKLCARKEQFVGGNVSTIDGLRVDFPNGWGLCRASNTTPVLVLRFEADDDASLAEIKAKFIMHLKDIDPSINCDF